jgi:4-hydroxy-tetrahydrodipicolinate synthase
MFQGSIPALITPFKAGKLDEAAFQALAEWQVREGSHGLVPCGTTGESAMLSFEEHVRVVTLCVEAAAGRVPVIAGAGANSTAHAVALAQACKRAGADAALVVAPYYVRPSQEGIIAHYKAISDAVEIPILVYNIPSRTGVDIGVETMARLAGLANVVGVKDATGDMTRVARHRGLCGEQFALLSGDDPTALGFNAHGGNGCISVTANVAPKLCAQVQAACLGGDYASARAIDAKLVALHAALFVEPSPAPAKYACSLLGKSTEEVRLPLLACSEAARQKVRTAMAQAGLV